MDLDRFFCFSIAYKRIRNGQELNFHRRLTRDGRELATPLLFLAFTKDISSGSARFLLSSSTKRNKKKKGKGKRERESSRYQRVDSDVSVINFSISRRDRWRENWHVIPPSFSWMNAFGFLHFLSHCQKTDRHYLS